MTDNEIIKALEVCCGNIKREEVCDETVCYQSVLPESRDGDTRWCRQWLIKDAIDLINRLQEQNAALIAGQETLQKCIAERHKEITRLQGIILAFMDEVAKMEDEGVDVSKFPLIPICDEGRNTIDRYSALAIKEFAEKFKKKIKDIKFTLGQTWEIQNALKDTMKEMVGDAE